MLYKEIVVGGTHKVIAQARRVHALHSCTYRFARTRDRGQCFPFNALVLDHLNVVSVVWSGLFSV